MLVLHPNILEKNGKKQFAILPFDEFVKIQEELQNYEDLKDIRAAKEKEKDIPGMSLAEAKKEWSL